MKTDPSPTFAELPADVKRSLRLALHREQGGLCAYCMGRVAPDAGRIEHWAPQSRHPALQLEFGNLLLACDGGPPAAPHCDVKKGNTEILLDPTKPSVETQTWFNRTCVYLVSERHQSESDDTLGLNGEVLRRRRRAALAGLKRQIERRAKKGPAGHAWMSRVREALAQPEAGLLKPYVRVLTTYLEQRLRRG